MGIAAQSLYIRHGIACGSPRTEAICTDIHGISAMIDGCNAARKVFGRRQQLEFTHK